MKPCTQQVWVDPEYGWTLWNTFHPEMESNPRRPALGSSALTPTPHRFRLKQDQTPQSLVKWWRYQRCAWRSTDDTPKKGVKQHLARLKLLQTGTPYAVHYRGLRALCKCHNRKGAHALTTRDWRDVHIRSSRMLHTFLNKVTPPQLLSVHTARHVCFQR